MIFVLIISCFANLISSAPKNWQMGFQEAATPIMEKIVELHNLILGIIIFIAIFVLCLLIFSVYRFHHKRNPTPSKKSHHSFLEIFWTLIPTLILVYISIPSIKLLFFMDKAKDPDLTIKVTAHQWYWDYDYPQFSKHFESHIIKDHELQKHQLRLLSVDKPVYVPLNKVIRILVTSSDVIHSWAVPSLGVKIDAIPGRINEVWIKIKKPGLYYGQCSELCGMKHGSMPICVKAVDKQSFEKFKNMKEKL